jgi:hypothetical protein
LKTIGQTSFHALAAAKATGQEQRLRHRARRANAARVSGRRLDTGQGKGRQAQQRCENEATTIQIHPAVRSQISKTKGHRILGTDIHADPACDALAKGCIQLIILHGAHGAAFSTKVAMSA